MTEQTAHTRRRITLLLLILAGTISCVDRASLAVAGDAIMQDMHLSFGEMGALLSVFAWAYLVGQIPVGLLADRISIRILLGCGLLAWSCAQMAFGLATGSIGLIAARIGLGLGETPLFLSGTRALVLWYSPQARGRPIGLFNASASLGPALAPPLILAIMALRGWRGMSVGLGGASLVLAALWIAYYRDPPRPAEPLPNAKAEPAWHALSALLEERACWAVTIGFVGVIYLTGLYGAWMPVWLETAQKGHAIASPRLIGLLSTIPQLAGFFGSVLGGVLSDRLARSGLSRLAACRAPLVIAMLASALATAAIPLQSSLPLTLLLMAIALFAGGIASTCGWMLATIVTVPRRIATLEAIQNTGGSLGGGLASIVTGLLAERWHGFTGPAYVAAAIIAACACVYALFLHETDSQSFAKNSP